MLEAHRPLLRVVMRQALQDVAAAAEQERCQSDLHIVSSNCTGALCRVDQRTVK